MNTTALSLLDRIRAAPEDNNVWARLDEIYRPLLSSWISRDANLRPWMDDIIQEVMTTLVKELPTFERQRQGSFRKWLRTIMVHRILNVIRVKRKENAGAEETFLSQLADPNSELSNHWDREHDDFVLNRMMEKLSTEFSQPQWQAFRLQAIEGRKAADVADELGMTVNAVMLAKSRVLQRLREEAKGLVE